MKTCLDDLEDRMQAINETPCIPQSLEGCGASDAMAVSLSAIQRPRGHGYSIRVAKGGSIREAVLHFKETGKFRNYREGRYVCIGTSLEVSGWCLLEEPELLQKLLFWCRMSVLHQARRFYSCLLESVRSFSEDRAGMTAARKAGWLVLRDWLEDYGAGLTLALQSKARSPVMFNENENLLKDKLCKLHPQSLLAGDELASNMRVMVGDMLPRDRLRVKLESRMTGRYPQHPRHVMSEPLHEGYQRLDFGFAEVIQAISFQLDNQPGR